MDMLKLKAYSTAAVIGLAVLPKLAYVGSDYYIRSYNSTSAYISEVTESALGKVGLAKIKDEEDLNSLIEKEAKNFKINPLLLKSLVKHESAGNQDALSLKGAIGNFQIMSPNAKRCGLKKVSELWITEKNVKCGSQILSEELATYKGDLNKALQSYNGGPRAVNKFPESIKYANNVMSTFAQLSYKQ